MEDAALEEMSNIAAADKDYQEVVATIRGRQYDGKKIRNLHKSHPANQYRSQWDSMTVDGIFLTYHGRMVVPEAARPEVLANLHIQHTGVSKTLMDARQLYYWPGMTNAIELMISQCTECRHACHLKL